jgi:D-alanine-D-alanine ligase
MQSLVVFTGGYSGEAVISRKSAAMVMANIDRSRFNPVLVHIDTDGWFSEIDGIKTPTSLGKLMNDPADFIGAFIMVHGTPGENGILQAELKAAGFPYTTGDAAAMALTFHKGRTTEFLGSKGIPVARAIQIANGEAWSADDLVAELGLPCFVKPNETGSSIGISKVSHASGLDEAIAAAMAISDSGVVVESLLTGREFTSGVMPDASGRPVALPVTEIRTHREFFDYEAKYAGESEEITPAEISDAWTARLQQMAVAVYEATAMRGMARIDMMSESADRIHVIEINAVPGFSEASIIPKQAEAMGLSKMELISRIIDQTLMA